MQLETGEKVSLLHSGDSLAMLLQTVMWEVGNVRNEFSDLAKDHTSERNQP